VSRKGYAFAEPVADFQHSRTVPLVCFIVSARKITHIGLGRRGNRAGTGLSRLNIDRVKKSLSLCQFRESSIDCQSAMLDPCGSVSNRVDC
jgi:hypothetical protein